MATTIQFKRDVVDRALIAFVESDGAGEALLVQRVAKRLYQTKKYLVLVNIANEPMATYRIQNDGSIKRLKEPPAALLAEFGGLDVKLIAPLYAQVKRAGADFDYFNAMAAREGMESYNEVGKGVTGVQAMDAFVSR